MKCTFSTGRLRLPALAVSMVVGWSVLVGVGPAVADGDSSGGRTSSSGNCTMYANGAGMGSYCTSATGLGGGGVPLTLRQRFGGQTYDRCVYDDPLPGVAPTEVKNDHGRWMLRSCLAFIDLDTYNGGDRRSISLAVVWIDDDVDTGRHNSPLNDYLWSTVQTQYPVPVMTFQPSNGVARVNQPAYATFRWSNAKHPRQVVAQGPYDGLADGGPYVQEVNGDKVTMTAQATKVTLDPDVTGEETVECVGEDVNPTYDLSRDIDEQDSECFVTFDRSSANASELGRSSEFSAVPYTFSVRVVVTWDVSYQQGAEPPVDMGEFNMVVFQPVAVREVDALNVPLVDWSLL